MQTFPRREIDELIQIAKYEPSIQSIYVEGKFDKDFFDRYLKAKGRDLTISVYSIDTIEVENQLLLDLKLNLNSNKSRVIALADQLNKRCEAFLAQTICIVDVDCDRELDKLTSLPSLCNTDFTCLEMYGLDEQTVIEIFEFSLNSNENHAKSFMKLLDQAMPVLFSLRCCNEELAWNATMPDLSVGLNKVKKTKSLEFLPEKYLRVFIDQNNLNAKRDEVELNYRNRLSKLKEDIRDKAHGHDTIRLLFAYLSSVGILTLKEAEIEKLGNRLFLGGINFLDLDKFSLFSTISNL